MQNQEDSRKDILYKCLNKNKNERKVQEETIVCEMYYRGSSYI